MSLKFSVAQIFIKEDQADFKLIKNVGVHGIKQLIKTHASRHTFIILERN